MTITALAQAGGALSQRSWPTLSGSDCCFQSSTGLQVGPEGSARARQAASGPLAAKPSRSASACSRRSRLRTRSSSAGERRRIGGSRSDPVLDKVIFMLMTVALIGLLILFGLASAVGIVDGRSQRSAWNRIAAGRRHLAEYRSALHEHELSLDARRLDLDALERRLQLRERTAAEQERALDDRVRCLERREQELTAREGLAARGPDAA